MSPHPCSGCAGSGGASFPRARVVEEEAHRGGDRRVGAFGERLRDARDRPYAADVAQRDQQRGLRLHPTKKPHRLLLRGGIGERGGGLRQEPREMLVGIGLQQSMEPLGVGAGELPEVWRAVREALDHRACLRRAREQVLEAPTGGRAGDLGEPGGDLRPGVVGGGQERRGNEAGDQRR